MNNKQVLITHTGKSFCNTGGSIWTDARGSIWQIPAIFKE